MKLAKFMEGKCYVYLMYTFTYLLKMRLNNWNFWRWSHFLLGYYSKHLPKCFMYGIFTYLNTLQNYPVLVGLHRPAPVDRIEAWLMAAKYSQEKNTWATKKEDLPNYFPWVILVGSSRDPYVMVFEIIPISLGSFSWLKEPNQPAFF